MSRYSQLYVERGRPTSDSVRARMRICATFQERFQDPIIMGKIKRHLTKELGVKVDDSEMFFKTCEIRDFLDTVTEVSSFLARQPGIGDPKKAASDWQLTADRVFVEENLAYRVGDDAIVHPHVDAEFQQNRVSALAALDENRFAGARSNFEAAFRHLRNREGKQALRMMFPAVETAAKVLFPGKFAALSANEVDKYVKPALERRYAGNQPALDAGRRLLDGMKNWINAAHPYRHGQEQHETAEPPADFVVAHLSAGATYLRWMIELC
jgi:hypothetical protein